MYQKKLSIHMILPMWLGNLRHALRSMNNPRGTIRGPCNAHARSLQPVNRAANTGTYSMMRLLSSRLALVRRTPASLF